MEQYSVIQVRAKISHPLGMQSGLEDDPIRVLNFLAVEMMAHRSDLREQASRTSEPSVKILYDTIAENIEHYAAALSICVFQMMDNNVLYHANISGLLELAKTHDLYLPERLREKAEADKNLFAEMINKGAEVE